MSDFGWSTIVADLRVLPDVEVLVVQFLLDQADVDDICGEQVVTTLPKDNKTFPAVRVAQFDDRLVTTQPLHVVRTSLQIDAWGGPKRLAKKLAETCRAALHASLRGVHDEGVVTGIATSGMRYLPDPSVPTENGAERPRWLFVATVTSHPLPAGGS